MQPSTPPIALTSTRRGRLEGRNTSGQRQRKRQSTSGLKSTQSTSLASLVRPSTSHGNVDPEPRRRPIKEKGPSQGASQSRNN